MPSTRNAGGTGTKAGSKSGLSWAVIALAVAAIAGAVWLSARAGAGAERAEKPAVCTQCDYQGMITVGDAPGQDPWPQECPKCRTKHLYMSVTCPHCLKPIPQKDSNGEGFGQPTVCPACKQAQWNT